jgi:nitroreductase
MDDLLELMKTRRSIRRYQDKDVSDELLEKIMEAGRWALEDILYYEEFGKRRAE